MNRRAAALARRSGTGTPADRPRQRRSGEQQDSRAVARAVMFGVEVRAEPDPGDGTVGFRAYASITEHPYDMWDFFGPYTETIAATAFDATLAAQPDVAYLLNHGGMTLARTTSGTLSLGRDDTGLWYEPRLDPANPDVTRVLSGVRRGDLDESSFAFRITNGSWSPDYTAYRIEQLDLHRGDVSTVNYGANPETGAHPIVLGLAEETDALIQELDDEQALALAQQLETRAQRRAAARPPVMSSGELDALRALAAPHPLTGRVHK